MKGSPIHILLVEDSPLDAELTLARLTRGGLLFRVDRVVSREEFITAIESVCYDLILADYVLPGFDGLSAMRLAREKCPQTPFIFVSGGLGEEIAIESLKLGAVDYVLKQKLDRLVPAVMRALAEARERAERRRVEAALEKSQERLRLAMDATGLGTWDRDLVTGEVNCDERCCAIFGITPGTPVSQEMLVDRIHPSHREHVIQRVTEAMTHGNDGHFETEFRVVRPNATALWVIMRGQIVFASGEKSANPVRAIGTVVDITSKKEAQLELERARQEAEAASNAKDRFLAILSHELRTPLSPILTTVQLMEMEPALSDEMRQNLSVIRRNAELEARLIDDLLDLTRITRGKLQLNRNPVNLHALIQGVIEICRSDLLGKRHEMKLELNAQHMNVNGDAARLQQVLWNLIKNAVKFTPMGGQIRIRTRDGDNHTIVVEVQDSGIGIEPESLGRIFSPFEQADDWITRRFGGLGLGLTIAKALTEKHRGTIHVHSDGLGKGATFSIVLPTINAPERHDVISSEPSNGDGASLQILLVEDHKDTARAMARLLRRAGHEVAVAHNVEAALKLSTEQKFDLLISDIGLPDGTGLDVVSRWDGRKRQAPSIALTGFGMDQDVARCRAAGFTEHLTKPVNFARLEAMIRSMATPSLES